ncbi:uncharacterized protein LOC133176275 [Saccostrea echinata]|uniref:uncharacterized protein LOC133176275 n=1 Tax=Saccostrea echinata TaxID=191078 RepID=UPI002A832DEC|nr:uncharacterized protein LOC133176275 [Saccostrea echinata]
MLKVSLQVNIKNETHCEGRPSPCCAGFMLNTNLGLCIACPLGYFGPKCNRPCPYPQFGRFCQRRCLCERKKCNKRTGCIKEKYSGQLQTEKPFVKKTELFSAINKSNAMQESVPRTARKEDDYVRRESIALSKEDSATPIRYTIVSLVGVSVLLMTLYIASNTFKRHRRQGKGMDLENRENIVNSPKDKTDRL